MKTILAEVLVLLISTMSIFAQGSLTPPAEPAPTMKSLDQIEARTPIDATNTPGDDNQQFIITQPGSYYLTGNMTGVSGKNGISIQASNVTVDLNGFALIGVTGSFNGLVVSQGQTNIRVHNGSAVSWPFTAFYLQTTTGGECDHLRASQNGGTGLNLGDNFVVNNVIANANGDGLVTRNNCVIDHATATANSDVGIGAGSDCVLKDCNASGNSLVGIAVADRCVVAHCTVATNGPQVSIGFEGGIVANANCQITDNAVSGNKGPGIRTADRNNRIDSNLCVANTDYGIKSSGPIADFITRNSCENNGGAGSPTATPNYSPKSGAYFGLLTSPGNASATPWSNFE